jgi:ABC-type lipoprotein release transport system permease subunit
MHDPDFMQNQDINDTISNRLALQTSLQNSKELKSWSERSIVNAMAGSAAGNYGVRINGVDPSREKEVSSIHSLLKEGTYFELKRRNPIVIGQKLAERLKVKIRSKIVLTFLNSEGDIIAGSFRVAGIYKTASSNFDERQLYVKQDDLFRLLGKPMVHEIAMIHHDMDSVNNFTAQLNENFPESESKSWGDLAPELGYANKMLATMLYLYISIVLLAMAFGIINTMLMAVLERKRELGMLLSVGMNKQKVFVMIMLETVLLAMIGGPAGILAAYQTINYYHKEGIDLSAFAKGLENVDISPIVYTDLDPFYYWNIGGLVMLTALLASIYPSIKALKLKPAEAVRAI